MLPRARILYAVEVTATGMIGVDSKGNLLVDSNYAELYDRASDELGRRVTTAGALWEIVEYGRRRKRELKS